MKKIFLMGLAALGLLATSCLKEEGSKDVMLLEMGNAVVASIEQDAQTKTTLDKTNPTSYKLFWAAGDAISIPYVKEGSVQALKYELKSGEKTTEGTFVTSETPAAGATVAAYAFYPHNAAHGETTVCLPAEYTVDGENTNALMISSTAALTEATPKLSFKHMGGVVAISLKHMPVGAKAVRLTANKGITGNFAFAADADGNQVVNAAAAAEGNTSVTINFPALEAMASKTFHFPLPVGTYQFKVEYQVADAWTPVIDSKQDNELGRAKLLQMPALDLNPAKITVSFTEGKTTSVDAELNVEATGGNGEFLYYIQPLGFNVADDAQHAEDEIAAQIKSATSTSDVLTLTDGKFTGSLLTLYREYMGSTTKTLNVGETVFVAVVPADNKAEDAVVYGLVTLGGYSYNEDSEVSVTFGTPTESFSTVSVKVSTTLGTNFWYVFIDKDTYLSDDVALDIVSGKELMEYILFTTVKDDDGEEKRIASHKATTQYSTSVTCSVKEPVMGKSYMLLVYAYDSATAEGKTFTKELTCPAIEYNEDISLDLTLLYTGANYAEVSIVPDGGDISKIRYAFMRKADFEKNATLNNDFDIAEIELVKNLTVSNRRNFETDYLSSDNKYTIENMYLGEEQYLFVLAYDDNNKVVHMKNVLVNTANAFNNGFSTELVAPTVKEVYYIAGNSTGYKKALTEWSKMSAVTDVTTLDDLTGMYWLDLDWSETGKTVKRMWLSSENHNNWNATYPITGTDKKADALSVLKKRAGYQANSVSPDFYGLNATTGALALTGVQVMNTSEYKALRDKTVTPYGPKTIHLVWETTDGKYGYTTVVPEDYASEDSGETPGPGEDPEDPSAGALADSPWGRCWVWQEEGMAASFTYMMLDMGKTTPNKVTISMGKPDEDMENMIFTTISDYTCDDTPQVKTSAEGNYLAWDDAGGNQYRIYYSDLVWPAGEDKVEGEATIWSAANEAYETVGIESKVFMKTYEAIGLPPFTYVSSGVGGQDPL